MTGVQTCALPIYTEVGYVGRDVESMIRDIAKAGGLLDKVIRVGANDVRGVSFTVDDQDSLMDEARQTIGRLGAAAGAVGAATAEAGQLGQLFDKIAGQFSEVKGGQVKLGFDDALDVVGVHMVGGLTGTLLIGFLGYGVSLVLFVLALRGLGAARTGAYFQRHLFWGRQFPLCCWASRYRCCSGWLLAA